MQRRPEERTRASAATVRAGPRLCEREQSSLALARIVVFTDAMNQHGARNDRSPLQLWRAGGAVVARAEALARSLSRGVITAVGGAVYRRREARCGAVTGQEITDRKIAEAALRDSDEKFRQLTGNITDVFWIRSADMRELHYLSPAFERIWGRSVASLYADPHKWMDFILPEDLDLVRDGFARLLADRTALTLEYRIARPDGEVRWVRVRGFPVLNAAGSVVRHTGIVTDITDRRAAETALQESEGRYRALIEWSPGPIAVSRHGIILFVNPAAVRMMGAECAADLIGRPLLDWVHPDCHALVRQRLRSHAENGSPLPMAEERFVRKDGAIIDVEVQGMAISYDGGAAIFSSMRDVTEHNRAEADQRRLQAAVAKVAVSVSAAVGTEFFVTLARNMADALGASAAFITQLQPGTPPTLRTIAAIVHGEAAPNIEYALKGTPCESLVVASDVVVIEKDLAGRFPDSPFNAWVGGEGYVGRRLTGSDETPLGTLFVVFEQPLQKVDFITSALQIFAARAASELERQTDNAEKRRLESQSLRAQRMESIGTLAGGIAHDLNNVLAPILMSVELLNEMVRNDEDRELVTTLHDSAQRGADLVKQVLSFARGVEGERILVDPVHLVRDLLKVMADTFPKSIEVRFLPTPGLWTVTGDPTQMHQVFLNLCINARDAMPGGGRLTVSLANVDLAEAEVRGQCDRPGAFVMLRVQDTGAGIPPEVRDRIFEPFYTTKEIGKGTGLGLSTALAIIRSHLGFIQVDSEPGMGATFTVYLPANTTGIAPERVSTEPIRMPGGHGELILVVDDEDGVRALARRTLERFGYRVLLARDGADAVSLYTRHGHEIAAVLTDMTMPIMDGPALIIALTAINPRVRVIGSSGLTSSEGVNRSVGEAVEHFLPKPYTAEALLRMLQKALAAAPNPQATP